MRSRTDARVKWSSSATATKNFKCLNSTAVLYELRLNSATRKSWTTYRNRTYGADGPAIRHATLPKIRISEKGNAMRLPRRQFLHLAAGAAALPAVSHFARAQAYPTRPIRLVVPFPPGGGYDLVGRPWADKMKSLLGTIVVENMGGGGSSLGAAAVARASPDGYTLLVGGTIPHINEAVLKARPLYDPIKDLHPISCIAVAFFAIAINPSLPAQTLKEFIDYAKVNPGKLSYGHNGVGSVNHLT